MRAGLVEPDVTEGAAGEGPRAEVSEGLPDQEAVAVEDEVFNVEIHAGVHQEPAACVARR